MKIKLCKLTVMILLCTLLFGCDIETFNPHPDICYYGYIPKENMMFCQYIVLGTYLERNTYDEYSVYNIKITEILKGDDIDGIIDQAISLKGDKYYDTEKSMYIDFSEIMQLGDECMFFLDHKNNDFYMHFSINFKDINNSLSFIQNLSLNLLGLPDDTTKEAFIEYIKACIYEYTPRREELINTPICDVSATYLFGDINKYNLPEEKTVRFFNYTFLTDRYGRASVVKNTAENGGYLEANAYPYKIVINSDFEKIEKGMGLAEIVSLVEVPISASEEALMLEYRADEGGLFTIYLTDELTVKRVVKNN